MMLLQYLSEIWYREICLKNQ